MFGFIFVLSTSDKKCIVRFQKANVLGIASTINKTLHFPEIPRQII